MLAEPVNLEQIMKAKIKIIKAVLMCRPLYYSISYTINPWMVPGSENKSIAQIQWENLIATYKNLGIKINVIDQKDGLPDMVFSTDQGVVQGKKVFMSSFRYPQRQGERAPYLKWFKDHNFEVEFFPKNAYFEGNGECLFFKDILLIGIGFRANMLTCKCFKKALKTEVIPLELINPYFYHLDTALFVLNDVTIFYYPQAFSKKSQKVLKKLVPNLIPFTDFEVRNFAANSVVTDHQVIVNRNLPTFRNTLNKLGYSALEIDLNEFTKAGGAAHCLTNVLKEEII